VSSGPLRVYAYTRCATCRKALQWLAGRGIPVEVIDITTEPPSIAELTRAWNSLDQPRRLFNTSGQSYRALGAATVRAMTSEQAIAALAADGKLIRRPFLITEEGVVLTGFDPQQWSTLLPAPSPAP
jgi:arsenate reductase